MIIRIAASDFSRECSGGLVIDVREPGEFAGKRCPGSRNVPLAKLAAEASGFDKGRRIFILCQSGRRSEEAARRLESLGFSEIAIVEGGLQALERSGGALQCGPGGVWSMERQVRLAAGSLVVAGCALGWLVHPSFWLLAAAVGAGLVFSAATDTCGMAKVLAWMPWNRGSSAC